MNRGLLLDLFGAGWLLVAVAPLAGDPLDRWRPIEDTANSPGLAMRHGQGKWAGLRGSSVVVSTNRRDWGTTLALGPDEHASDLEFADGLWMIAGTRQLTNLFIFTSPDAEVWSAATNLAASTTGGLPPRIRRGADAWVVLVEGRLLRSADGRNWTQWPMSQPPAGANGGRIHDIAYGDGRWLGIVHEDNPGEVGAPEQPSTGSLAVSTNLEEWEWWQRPAPMFQTLKFAHGLWFGITHQPGWYGCGAVAGDVVTSLDGTNWTTRVRGDGLGEIALVHDRIVATANIRLCTAITTHAPLFPMFESESLLSLQTGRPAQVVVTRAAGIPAVVEASEDFRRWTLLTNLPAGDSVRAFTDPAASNMMARFYRVRTW